MKIGRINFSTKCREEATSRRIGRAEMWSGARLMGYLKERIMGTEKGEEQTPHTGESTWRR